MTIPSMNKPDHPTLAQAARVWTRISLLSFGGPAGQIALMHRVLVEEKRWLGDARFLHALNFCMILPGPEAQQLATYIGWLMHRTWGGVIAGALFVLPGAVAIMALSIIYALYGDLGVVNGLFYGVKAAVLAIVLQALFRIAGRSLRDPTMRTIAALSFLSIFVFQTPFPLIVLTAALVGYVGQRAGLAAFQAGGGQGKIGAAEVHDAETLLGEELETLTPSARRGALSAGMVAVVLWLIPVAALVQFAGPDSVFTEIALFFSQMAVVTFGGAYAVLSYVAQEAVANYGWLQPGEMLDGLAMAETTPGPLIMVTQFVGFMGAYRDPGALSPLMAGFAGGLLTTWVTFAPCFAWIFLGAPWMEGLRSNKALTAALSAVTAAVVGVILNLSVWFAMHVIFAELVFVSLSGFGMEVPVWSSVDLTALGLSIAAIIATFRFKMGVIPLIAAAAMAGIALHYLAFT